MVLALAQNFWGIVPPIAVGVWILLCAVFLMVRKQRTPLIVFLLTVTGLLVSMYLTYHHNLAVNKPGYKSGCSISQTIDCDAVNTSVYAEISLAPLGFESAKIPVSMLGMIFYVLLVALAFVRWKKGAEQGSAPLAYLCIFSGFGLLFSGTMAYLSLFVLKKLCPFCTDLYLVALLLPFAAWRLARSDELQVLGAVKADLGSHWKARSLTALIGGGAILGTAIVLSSFSGGTSNITGLAQEWAEAPKALVGPGSGYVKGARNPKLTIIDFSDLECPACRQEAQELNALVKKYPDLVQVVYRHFPLDPRCNPMITKAIHPFACSAAIAAECAGQQGKFWEYHDRLFPPMDQPKPNLERSSLELYGKDLGLNLEEFNRCLDESKSLRAKIRMDIQDAQFIGINSTPTLVVNHKKLSRIIRLAEWEEILRLEKLITPGS